MKDIIEIRVASKIDVDKIVINKGQNDGIEKNMRFLVYTEGKEIFDPVTNKSLGILENPKGTFKVLHVQDSMAIILSELKKPSNLALSFAVPFGELDIERELLKSINVGDKVKIIR